MQLTKKFTHTLGAFAIAGLILTGSGVAQAQPGGGQEGPGRWGNPVARLTETLDLTASQQAQIQTIFDRRLAEGKARREAFEASMTPEQKAEMEARRKEHEARMAEHRAEREAGKASNTGNRSAGDRPRGPRPGGPGGEMANMTDEQRQAMRGKMEADRAAMDAEIKAVLTPAQQQKFEQMKAARREHGPRGDGGGKQPR